jgi:hypothetical protein
MFSQFRLAAACQTGSRFAEYEGPGSRQMCL